MLVYETSSNRAHSKYLKKYHALDKAMRAYKNKQFLTVTYVTSVTNEVCFEFIIAPLEYKRSRYLLFWERSLKKDSVSVRFNLGEIDMCEKLWLKLRDIEFKRDWREW